MQHQWSSRHWTASSVSFSFLLSNNWWCPYTLRRAKHQTHQPSECFPRDLPRSFPYKQNPPLFSCLYYKNRAQSNKGKQVNKQNVGWTCHWDKGGEITRIRTVYVCKFKLLFFLLTSLVFETWGRSRNEMVTLRRISWSVSTYLKKLHGSFLFQLLSPM